MRQHSLANPSAGRHLLWLSLLVAASVMFTLGLACAVPLAAFAAAAAVTLRPRDAMLFVGAVWLANQIVGFAILDYPQTANSILWGVALGAVGLLATWVARSVAHALPGANSLAVSVAAFLASFAAYEGALYVIAATWLGGTEDFAPGIVAWIFAVNAAAMIALMLLHRLGAAVGFAAISDMRGSAAAHHA